MPPPANERRNASQGRYNRLHDLEMAQRDWLEEQGLPAENNENHLPSVNDNIRQQELDRERERRARTRRRANPDANRQPNQSNPGPLTSEEIQSQRNLAAEWARSQDFLNDNPPSSERGPMGGKKIKSKKHSRKIKLKKHSRKMKSKKHSRKMKSKKHSRKH